MVVIRDLTSRKHKEHWQSIRGQTQAKGLLRTPSAKGTEELLSLSQNQQRMFMWLLAVHCYLNGHLLTLRFVYNPSFVRCKQAFEKSLHVLCDCEALAALTFRHTGQHFMKPSDFDDFSVSRILHCVQGAGLLNI